MKDMPFVLCVVFHLYPFLGLRNPCNTNIIDDGDDLPELLRSNKRISLNKTVYLNAKLPALLSSLTQVTESLPNSAVSPRFGQYWWHFTRPRSTMVVSIMMREDWLSHVMYQKSVHVEANGPCVAIYLVLRKK